MDVSSLCGNQPATGAGATTGIGGGDTLGNTFNQSYPILQSPRAATAGAPTWGLMGGGNTGTGAAPTPAVSGPTQATAGPVSYLSGGANTPAVRNAPLSVPSTAPVSANSAGAENAAAANSFKSGGG